MEKNFLRKKTRQGEMEQSFHGGLFTLLSKNRRFPVLFTLSS